MHRTRQALYLVDAIYELAVRSIKLKFQRILSEPRELLHRTSSRSLLPLNAVQPEAHSTAAS